MAKIKKAWFCTACGNESAKWMGKCPACGEWNTMTEEIVSKGDEGVATSRNRAFLEASNPTPLPLSQISSGNENRINLGNGELERVLGGGLVEGSLVLIGGEPGIGKSTLSLQIPLHCNHLKTLYVSGEESARQLKLRADRLAPNAAGKTAAVAGTAASGIDNCLILDYNICKERLVCEGLNTKLLA